jgi:LacI family transcriptional regulator, repressor for deo operon, udp, cdd, tsx, nupC, and nupG
VKKSPSPSSKSVAAELGVSVATISRVLTRPDLVNRQTRDRVLQGIERLGYRPNLIARDLRRGETRTVLVVVPKLSAFFLEILRGTEQAAEELGFAVLMGNAKSDIRRTTTYFDQVASRRADGIILLTGVLPPGAETIATKLPPLVIAAESLRDSALPTVGIDHVGGAEEAVRHLIGLGHRRIAHIAGPDHVLSSRARAAGYRKALRAARLPFEDTLIQRGDFSVESGGKMLHVLMQQKPTPTAIFCANDEMAIGAIQALRLAGLSVPADVSIVGFDDQQIAELYDPPLTTVHIPRFDIGYQSMMMLRDLITPQRSVRSTVLPTRLIVRATSVAPRKR